MNAHTKQLLSAIATALLASACSEGATEPQSGQSGSMRISVQTVGGDLDEDGYSLVVDSASPVRVASVSTTLYENVSAGTHVITLSGIADNCSLEGPASRSVIIAPGETTGAELTVTCDATGIQITTRTTGPDQPAGYQLKIVEPLPMIGERYGAVAPTGTLLTTRLQPGIHTVELSVFDNCTVTGGNVVTVNVSSRAVTAVTFEITCVPIDKAFAFVHDSLAGNFYRGSFVVVASPKGSIAQRIASGHG